MNIPIGSTVSSPCANITIQSNGESAFVHDGLYEQVVFGKYRFLSIDARGNNVYHANTNYTTTNDLFLNKDMGNYWKVSATSLWILKCMM